MHRRIKKEKDKLFNHIISIEKPLQKPTKTIEQLKKEVGAIQGGDAQKYDLLPKLNFSANDVESNELFKKQIVGNENSTVAELIKQLGNSDWVKRGLDYLPENISQSGEKCPFCQEKTITTDVKEKIKSFLMCWSISRLQSAPSQVNCGWLLPKLIFWRT